MPRARRFLNGCWGFGFVFEFQLGQIASLVPIRATRAPLAMGSARPTETSSISLPTIKRLESQAGTMASLMSTVLALKKAIAGVGVDFIEENRGVAAPAFACAE
jgi:hypothetical protein